jgi:hypothetical protein
MARRRPRGARRTLTTAETMTAAVGPNPAALVRRGLSPARAQTLEREWVRWDEAHGFAWRVAAGIPTMADRACLDAGEEPGDSEPPGPPGFDLAG